MTIILFPADSSPIVINEVDPVIQTGSKMKALLLDYINPLFSRLGQLIDTSGLNGDLREQPGKV